MNSNISKIDSCFAKIQRIVNEQKNPYGVETIEYAEFEGMRNDIIVSCMDLNMHIGDFLEKTV